MHAKIVPSLWLNVQPDPPSRWDEVSAWARDPFSSERLALSLMIAATLGMAGWLSMVLQHAFANYCVF